MAVSSTTAFPQLRHRFREAFANATEYLRGAEVVKFEVRNAFFQNEAFSLAQRFEPQFVNEGSLFRRLEFLCFGLLFNRVLL